MEAVWWPCVPPGSGGKRRDDHVRLEFTHDAHDIREHRLTVPFGERLLVIFRETEILRAGEELLASVDAAGREKFLGTDDSQRIADLRANKVLPALAARQ